MSQAEEKKDYLLSELLLDFILELTVDRNAVCLVCKKPLFENEQRYENYVNSLKRIIKERGVPPEKLVIRKIHPQCRKAFKEKKTEGLPPMAKKVGENETKTESVEGKETERVKKAGEVIEKEKVQEEIREEEKKIELAESSQPVVSRQVVEGWNWKIFWISFGSFLLGAIFAFLLRGC